MSQPLLRLSGIAKSYAAVRALVGVDLDVHAGEIHAVLGENGAGKSTLMKSIFGAVQPDVGQVCWQGRPVSIDSPVRARALGVAMVFQHFALFESMTVAENVALALGERVPLTDLSQRLREVSDRYGLPINPEQPVYRLSVGERQRVEIVRCLLQSPRLLIMDEPTSVLTPQAIEQLFETLRRLAAEGTAILYVSHKLDEIRRLCDRATIIRQGRVVACVDPRVETETRLAELMIGHRFPETERRAKQEGAVALEVSDLDLPADGPFGVALHGVGFEVRRGDVLGIAGISGNGQSELLSAVLGTRAVPAGAVRLAGQAVGRLGVAARRQRGLAVVPEERLGVGSVPEMSLTDNVLLTAWGRGLVRWGVIAVDRARDLARRCIADYAVRAAGTEATAASLSGGNLQKFIVAREIAQAPRVLVLAQPTWGVDVAATALIRQRIIDLAAAGVAVLVISEDLTEILEVCDRVAVIAQGRLSPVRAIGDTSAAEIGRWMAGGFATAVEEAA